MDKYNILKESIRNQMTEITTNEEVIDIINDVKKGAVYLLFKETFVPEYCFTSTVQFQHKSLFYNNTIAYFKVDLPSPHDTNFMISKGTGSFYLKITT